GPTPRWQKPRKISAQLKSDANAVRVTASQGKSQSRATAIAVPVAWLTDRGLLATTAMPSPPPHRLRQILADRGGHSRVMGGVESTAGPARPGWRTAERRPIDHRDRAATG